MRVVVKRADAHANVPLRMVTIEDERAQTELCDAIRAGDGPAVARSASHLVATGRSKIVDRACRACASFCQPIHARAIIDHFAPDTARSRRTAAAKRRALADVVATVMAGVRSGCDAPAPRGKGRATVDAILESPAGRDTVSNIERLPSRPGATWAGIIALAREAVAANAVQEALVCNERLRDLFESESAACADGGYSKCVDRTRPDRAGAECSPSMNAVELDTDMKLGVLWSFSREPCDCGFVPGSPPVDVDGTGADRLVACSAIDPAGNGERVKCVLAAP